MLQRLSQVAKADCNSGTVDHPEPRLGASKFVNEVFEFECAILIHIDHIQSTWCRGYSSFQKARPGKEDLPALMYPDAHCLAKQSAQQSDIPDRCAAKRLAMHFLPQKGRFYVVPPWSFRLSWWFAVSGGGYARRDGPRQIWRQLVPLLAVWCLECLGLFTILVAANGLKCK